MSLLTHLINTSYGTESALNTSADDFKLPGGAGAGYPPQRDLHRLGKRPDRELVKVTQGKQKVLPWDRTTPAAPQAGATGCKAALQKKPRQALREAEQADEKSEDNCFYQHGTQIPLKANESDEMISTQSAELAGARCSSVGFLGTYEEAQGMTRTESRHEAMKPALKLSPGCSLLRKRFSSTF